jgi:hypothetical protein
MIARFAFWIARTSLWLLPTALAAQPLPDHLNSALPLLVARVEVVREYQPRADIPFVDQEMPSPMVDALGHWAEQNFLPAGSDGHARIIIREASLQRSEFEGEKRMFGLMSGPKFYRYNAQATVQVLLFDGSGFSPDVELEATAQQQGTIEAEQGVGYRHSLFEQMTKNLSENLARQLRSLIHQHGTRFLPQPMR